MNYLEQLEAMPWQLLWANAKLNVDEYPKSTLTLRLFTLSLDKKWLNL
jgi:MSHA biogenesis protein MshJ